MKFIPNSVTRKIGTTVLKTKKNSPTLFFVAGTVGVVGSAILACRATLKLDETLDDIQEDLTSVRELGDHRHDPSSFYDENEYRKDLVHVYLKAGWSITRLYGPSVAVGGLSIAALTGSHVTLVRRNTALTATVAALGKAFDDYRNRVRAELGEERELDIYHAVENRLVDNPDGTKEIAKITDPNGLSLHAKIFDESNVNWEKNAEVNRLFIQTQQQYLNNLLHMRGHVFLNDAYDVLGFDRTSPGAILGWRMGNGDDYVDLGMFDAYNSRFVNGHERSIILDFNIDTTTIYDKL